MGSYFSNSNSVINTSLLGGTAPITLPLNANIVFNLKADSLSLSDGAAVTSWSDTVNNLTFLNGDTIGGTFKTNVLGGKPSVRFNGIDQYLQAARAGTVLRTAMDSQNYTVLAICKINGVTGGGCVFGASASPSVSSPYIVGDGSRFGPYNPVSGLAYDMCATTPASSLTVGGFSSVTGYGYSFSNVLVRSYLNGTCLRSDSGGAASLTTGDFSIGNDQLHENATGWCNCDVFDIVVWNVQLTQSEIFQATKFYFNKYSQTYPWAAGNNIYVFDGDSLTAGTGAGLASATYPYKTAQALGLVYGQWTVAAVSGITSTQMKSKISEFSAVGSTTGKNLRVAAFEYYNQKANAPAQIEAANNAYSVAVRAIANTKLCLGSSSTSAASDPDATRVSVSAYYDANFATYSDSYVAMHLNVAIGTQTAYATNGNGLGLNLWADTVHLNDAGYIHLAGMFTTGLNSIP